MMSTRAGTQFRHIQPHPPNPPQSQTPSSSQTIMPPIPSTQPSQPLFEPILEEPIINTNYDAHDHPSKVPSKLLVLNLIKSSKKHQ